jgi:hypothetical protein
MDLCNDCKQSWGELVRAVRQHAEQRHCEALEEHNRNLVTSLIKAQPRTEDVDEE